MAAANCDREEAIVSGYGGERGPGSHRGDIHLYSCIRTRASAIFETFISLSSKPRGRGWRPFFWAVDTKNKEYSENEEGAVGMRNPSSDRINAPASIGDLSEFFEYVV